MARCNPAPVAAAERCGGGATEVVETNLRLLNQSRRDAALLLRNLSGLRLSCQRHNDLAFSQSITMH